MRKFSAHRIYPVNSAYIPFGIVETADDGTILNIRDNGGKPAEESGLEFYSGILVPGFINAHCHLELSHLKGLIPQQTGITGFVSQVSQIRASGENVIRQAAEAVDRLMYREGISGAGDISNNGITLTIKQNSHIHYHTFIELFGLNPETSKPRYDDACRLAQEFTRKGLSCSITPHAPYSVGIDLWEKLAASTGLTGRISIHHDESLEERELLERRTGKMADHFRQAGFDLDCLPAEAAEIYQLLGKYLPDSEWILVHNTVTDPYKGISDRKHGIYHVLCPRSNRYIESRLPDLSGFAASGKIVCLGTDSMASNLSLSIFEEMRTVMESEPGIAFETVLNWATINGARALGMEKTLGTIEPGKKPGLVHIPLFDWENNRLVSGSRSLRVI